MDTPTIISIISLIIAVLSLPLSYWIAVRQVKVGLDEQERRVAASSRLLVADRIEEFFDVFSAMASNVSGIPKDTFSRDMKLLDPHLVNIDNQVKATKVMERLAEAIDSLDSNCRVSGEMTNQLRTIRNQIALGVQSGHLSSLGIIAANMDGTLQEKLRNNFLE